MDQLASAARLIRFGVFELDLRTGELRKSGVKLRLHGQPVEILKVLLERPGELVTREELEKRLWVGDTVVEFEHSINAAVNRLREALGDSADNPRFIETLARRGYRFIYPVAPVEVGAHGVRPDVAAMGTHGVRPLDERATTMGTRRVRPDVVAMGTRRVPLQKRWRVIALTAASLVVIVTALLAFNVAGLRERMLRAVAAVSDRRTAMRTSPLQKIESIAVLPLENLSGDPAQEYFADGMTEALISDLGKISALRVISRTSVMRFKGARPAGGLAEIAQKLNVDAIVEGSVVRSGDRVRITANLLDARSERHLWAEAYDRDMQDILALQGEVARAIASEIKIKVTPQEQTRLASARPVNPEAYEAYLKGRSLLTRLALSRPGRFLEVLDTAQGYFQSALKKDPNYAPGYVGISLVWRAQGDFLPPRECFPKAKAAALKALELDNTLADAHEALAEINFYYEWDWTAAEKEYRRAIELKPNSGELRVGYMDLLDVMRRPQEAKAQIERALELDPVNPEVQFWFGLHLMFSRQYDAAIAQAREMLKVEPDAALPHVLLKSAFEAKSMFEEAKAEERKAFLDEREHTQALDRGFARGGYREAKRLVAELLVRLSKQTYVGPTGIAVTYAWAGEKDRAMEWLEKAYAERNPDMVHIGVAPDFDPLRSDRRFQALLRRMNFPP